MKELHWITDRQARNVIKKAKARGILLKQDQEGVYGRNWGMMVDIRTRPQLRLFYRLLNK